MQNRIQELLTMNKKLEQKLLSKDNEIDILNDNLLKLKQ
jgi:hypothetical protein